MEEIRKDGKGQTFDITFSCTHTHIHHWQTRKFHRRHAWHYEWHTVCGRRHTSSMNESIEMPSSCWFSYIYILSSSRCEVVCCFPLSISFRIVSFRIYIYMYIYVDSIGRSYSVFRSRLLCELWYFSPRTASFACSTNDNAESRLVCLRARLWMKAKPEIEEARVCGEREIGRAKEDREIFRWIENRIKWREKTVCDNQNDFRLMVFAAILLSIAFFLSSLFHHFSSFSYMRRPRLASRSDIWFWSLVLVRSFSDCVPYYYCQRREIVRKGRRMGRERETANKKVTHPNKTQNSRILNSSVLSATVEEIISVHTRIFIRMEADMGSVCGEEKGKRLLVFLWYWNEAQHRLTWRRWRKWKRTSEHVVK